VSCARKTKGARNERVAPLVLAAKNQQGAASFAPGFLEHVSTPGTLTPALVSDKLPSSLFLPPKEVADILTDRIRFITHQGKQILLVDLSNCSALEVEKIAQALPDLVATRPRGSVLILDDFTGASFDQEAIRAMKESAVFDKPYTEKSAWVGAEDLPEVCSESIRSFSRRDFPTFKTREEALAWLAKD
jgi:hypothetical protein